MNEILREIMIAGVIGLLIVYWRAINERSLYIHKLQFDKEFKTYTELYKKLVGLYRCATNLRPMMDVIDPEEPEEDRKKRKLDRINQSYNSAAGQVYDDRPFYSPQVYNVAKKLLVKAHNEGIKYCYGDPRNMEYWEEGDININELKDLIDEVHDSIRGRIWPFSAYDKTISFISNLWKRIRT